MRKNKGKVILFALMLAVFLAGCQPTAELQVEESSEAVSVEVSSAEEEESASDVLPAEESVPENKALEGTVSVGDGVYFEAPWPFTVEDTDDGSRFSPADGDGSQYLEVTDEDADYEEFFDDAETLQNYLSEDILPEWLGDRTITQEENLVVGDRLGRRVDYESPEGESGCVYVVFDKEEMLFFNFVFGDESTSTAQKVMETVTFDDPLVSE